MQPQDGLQVAAELDGIVLALLDLPAEAPAFEGEFALSLEMDSRRVEGHVDRLALGGDLADGDDQGEHGWLGAQTVNFTISS
jgi:hypothetical protein